MLLRGDHTFGFIKPLSFHFLKLSTDLLIKSRRHCVFLLVFVLRVTGSIPKQLSGYASSRKGIFTL
ncbi:Uncharacterised protein [Vibrio cholerae]|uniref:Uncharacterized protein n=1 Tax=Vibrio cholerae TaxID=666 RepID=A0A655YGU1_VIBCL|nr:Uncharacterised protein [Vibrio cholerae]CSA37453.1 Uncharacterised protein [Vibrio cholerae]CSC38838.1 Uncharacterised protein [Vibrio cholerae]